MARESEQSLIEARALGLKRYVSARPCPAGHLGERYTISSTCCACADAARAARLGNPDRVVHTSKPKPRRTVPPATFERPAFRSALIGETRDHNAKARSDYLDSLIRDFTKAKVPL